MPPTHRPRAISPPIARMKRESPGLSVRATAIPPPRRQHSGARHRGVTRPASHETATQKLGQLSSMAFRTPSVLAPLALVQSFILVQNVPPPTTGGHEVGRVEPDPCGPVRDLRSDLQLVGARIPVGRRRDGWSRWRCRRRIQLLEARRHGEELHDGTDLGPIDEHHHRVRRALDVLLVGSIVGNGKMPTSSRPRTWTAVR